ncbi:MAG: hypothetical protein IJP92_00925 [Lachnospiraceae bacterium]|nr:hypothetical protein [Lachnospiraceae bacterium]
MKVELTKEEALQAYKEAKERYLQDRSEKNWKEFCEAKKRCMLLGVRI